MEEQNEGNKEPTPPTKRARTAEVGEGVTESNEGRQSVQQRDSVMQHNDLDDENMDLDDQPEAQWAAEEEFRQGNEEPNCDQRETQESRPLEPMQESPSIMTSQDDVEMKE